MIYSSFVHRDCIQAAIGRFGAYFNIPQVPDVVSGVVNLLHADQILYSIRPLSVRGNSGKSNGTSYWARSLGGKQRSSYFEEERVHPDNVNHHSLIPSPNLNVLIASIKLQCKDRFFPERDDLTVSIVDLVASMIFSLNADPASYDDNLREARQLAAKNNIDFGRFEIPPKAVAVRRKYSGLVSEEKSNVRSIVVNCDLIGIHDVHAAGNLADALLPSCADAMSGIVG
jgi:hypothetical protein